MQTIYNLRSRLGGEAGGDREAPAKGCDPAQAFIAVRLAASETATPMAACRLKSKGWVME